MRPGPRRPCIFRRTLFVTDATSYGTYVAATDSSFWLSEPLLIYAEPIGYGYAPAAGGGFRFGLAFDLVVRDDRGNVVYEQADMARAQMTSTSRNRELMVKLTLSLSSGTPGAYTLEFTARDLAGAKTANFSLPFTLTE